MHLNVGWSILPVGSWHKLISYSPPQDQCFLWLIPSYFMPLLFASLSHLSNKWATKLSQISPFLHKHHTFPAPDICRACAKVAPNATHTLHTPCMGYVSATLCAFFPCQTHLGALWWAIAIVLRCITQPFTPLWMLQGEPISLLDSWPLPLLETPSLRAIPGVFDPHFSHNAYRTNIVLPMQSHVTLTSRWLSIHVVALETGLVHCIPDSDELHSLQWP